MEIILTGLICFFAGALTVMGYKLFRKCFCC